ncbi:MAG: TIGR02452 family protein, partial [Ktedonobacterales bacterium]|nr:TIGR02452 family protein [Ktedonobacterales bacterium]
MSEKTALIAQETLAALERGRYTAPDGTVVAIADMLAACLAGTRLYDPAALATIREQILRRSQSHQTTFAVTTETTLAACARLATDHPDTRIGVLNFASAKNPGGGFLKGAQAQEESLARSSGLYPSLLRCPELYAFHRAQGTCLYSDLMIYSPACPVLRDDAGNWLAQPYTIDIITSPAPNAGAILRNEPERRQMIIPTLRERAGKVLALAAKRGGDALV